MTSETQKTRVLLVDDESEFLDATAKALRRRGFDVTTVANGNLLMSVLKDVPIDVAVLDVKMPGMSGYDLFRELKNKLPNIPVIFLTGHGQTKMAFKLSKKGAFGYLAKPCAIDELAEKIREARKHAEAASDLNLESTLEKDVEAIRVLIIDDEEDFLDSVSRVLSRRKMTVHTANCGDEGIRIIREHPVDVVVLDIKMPGIHGIDVLAHIKKEKPLVEVILLTGHASVSTAVDGLKKGAFDYLHKPQDIEALCEVIGKAARKKWKSEADERSKRIKEIIEKNPT